MPYIRLRVGQGPGRKRRNHLCYRGQNQEFTLRVAVTLASVKVLLLSNTTGLGDVGAGTEVQESGPVHLLTLLLA